MDEFLGYTRQSLQSLCQPFQLLFLSYEEYLRASGHAELTVVNYTTDILPFLKYLQESGITDIGEVQASDIYAYNSKLSEQRHRGKALGPLTRAGRMDRVRIFFHNLHKQGKLASDPTANMTFIKRRNNIPKNVPEIKDMVAILELPDMETPIGMRDRAILELLYSTGLRNAELRRLECSDVNLDEKVLYVAGKGGRYAYVPFGREAAYALRTYLAFGRGALTKGYPVQHSRISKKRLEQEHGRDFLFISKAGHGLCSGDLQVMVKQYSERIGKTISPHGFRHACATHLLRQGADIRHIQQLLRHAHLNTTQIYTRVAIEDLKEAQRKFHPREAEALA